MTTNRVPGGKLPIPPAPIPGWPRFPRAQGCAARPGPRSRFPPHRQAQVGSPRPVCPLDATPLPRALPHHHPIRLHIEPRRRPLPPLLRRLPLTKHPPHLRLLSFLHPLPHPRHQPPHCARTQDPCGQTHQHLRCLGKGHHRRQRHHGLPTTRQPAGLCAKSHLSSHSNHVCAACCAWRQAAWKKYGSHPNSGVSVSPCKWARRCGMLGVPGLLLLG